MDAGWVVAGRFEIERPAGRGGMGTVYRAFDRDRGEPVAIKLIQAPTAEVAAHRLAEADALSRVSHPAVVRRVGHGIEGGVFFLVMEWLEGETLGDRLERGRLGVQEALDLGVRAADALAAVHAAGLVHRDVKPDNLLLVGGDVRRAMLVDFGIARGQTGDDHGGTVTAGTPGYMAPEQARGDALIDARADIFALGCVLFRCLAGRPPFAGSDQRAALLKVVLDEAPRLWSVDESLPVELDSVVARMLAKSARDRPDAAPVGRELASMSAPVAPPSRVVPSRGAAAERRPVTLVLTRPPRAHPLAHDEVAGLRAEMSALAAELQTLQDGTLLVSLGGAGAPTDRATRAARCALAFRRRLAPTPIVVASGRAVLDGGVPLGDVIDRATRELAIASDSGIFLDELTAGLLDPRFEVRTDHEVRLLVEERGAPRESRTLLGKPTPCVGREAELVRLERLLRARGEASSRVAVVSGPAGIGKSRLLHELLARLDRAEVRPEVWIARGDPVRSGAPFGVLAELVSDAVGLDRADAPDVRRGRLLEHGDTVAWFLGEVVGAPFDEEGRPELQAARQDPLLMRDQISRSWLALVAGRAARGELLLVIEDAHWSDAPSLALVGQAAVAERSPSVLAFARPEGKDLVASAWRDVSYEEVALGPLEVGARLELVRAALGVAASDADARAIADRSEGNAFYIEELIRAVARGHRDVLPDTVLAMAEARLEEIDPTERRVLCAASVLGQTFSAGLLRAVVGDRMDDVALDGTLRALVVEEVLVRMEDGAPGDGRLAFRHALLRDVAYARLTPPDRRACHGLAAEWLERHGSADPAALAEHFAEAGALGHAAPYFHRSAEQALDANDYVAALSRGDRAIGCGPSAAQLGATRALQAEAARYSGDRSRALRCALEAKAVLTAGGSGWYMAVGVISVLRRGRDDTQLALDLARELLEVSPAPRALPARSTALLQVGAQLLMCGHKQRATELFARLAQEARTAGEHVAIEATACRARALLALYTGDPAGYLRETLAQAGICERVGDLRGLCRARGRTGNAYLVLGAYAEAERTLREASEMSEAIGYSTAVLETRHNLAWSLAQRGQFEESRRLQEAVLAEYTKTGDARTTVIPVLYLASVLVELGEAHEAERISMDALLTVNDTSPFRARVLAVVAEARVARGDTAGALAASRDAMALLESLGHLDEGEARCRLAHVMALQAAGEHEAARAAVAAARAALLAQANAISDPAWRQSFLERVPEHARTLSLARDWLD